MDPISFLFLFACHFILDSSLRSSFFFIMAPRTRTSSSSMKRHGQGRTKNLEEFVVLDDGLNLEGFDELDDALVELHDTSKVQEWFEGSLQVCMDRSGIHHGHAMSTRRRRTTTTTPDKYLSLLILFVVPFRIVRRLFQTAFIPANAEGLPPDYLHFQAWDTAQALCSYIRGCLTTAALLKGAGVGDSTATAAGAALQWAARDASAHVGGITFAMWGGSQLGADSKQWRLAADFMNNLGLALELASPLLRGPYTFLAVACAGSLCRAICGAAAGASRAAFTAHFAASASSSLDPADIAVKEGTQETAASLIGLAAGSLLVRCISHSIRLQWICFLTLTAAHMWLNTRVVLSLRLRNLNRERATLALRHFLAEGVAPTPAELSSRESLMPIWRRRLPHVELGTPLRAIVHDINGETLGDAIARCGRVAENHLARKRADGRGVAVVIRRGAGAQDTLAAYTHGILLSDNDLRERNIAFTRAFWDEYSNSLIAAGWNLNASTLAPGAWRADW